MEEHIGQIGVKKKDDTDRKKWCNGVHELSGNMRRIRSPPLMETKPDF